MLRRALLAVAAAAAAAAATGSSAEGAAAAAAAAATGSASPAVGEGLLPPWPLEGTVDFVRQQAASRPLTNPTGFTKSSYLPVISGVVQFFRQYQAPNGTIIDPYRGVETQYATPCFAFGASLLYSLSVPSADGGSEEQRRRDGALYGDASLLANASAALGAAALELATHNCADGHCVFFMKPMMFAYRILSPLVDEATLAGWNASLSAMNPYVDFGEPTNNWGLVGTLDFLRTRLGFGNSSWWENMLDLQLGDPAVTLTGNGLYQDHTGTAGLNPLPYDTFPVSGYMTVLLQEGLVSKFVPLLNETTTRAVWTHSLMQSPWGEIPTGGRSSQHQWNEAVSALAYEVFAAKYAASGDAQSACMLKRSAHLSLGSVMRWQNPTGELQVVKNHFPASMRFGYEGYSYLSNYNLLPAAMLSAAYMYADDSVAECSAPADVGGFVFELPEHHIVIANMGGVYAEVELLADPHYDPMGLHRVHINTCGVGAAGACVATNALLTPTAGPPFYLSPVEAQGLAIGPWWATAADAPGTRTALAALDYSEVAGTSFVPATWNNGSSPVGFSVEYFLLTSGALVTQAFEVSVRPDGSEPAVSVLSSVQLLGGPALVARASSRGVALNPEHVERARALGVMDASWAATSPAANLTRFGMQIPVFLFDGRTNTTVAGPGPSAARAPGDGSSSGNNTVSVSGPAGSGWGTATFSAAAPAPGHAYTWAFDPTSNTSYSRNGVMAAAWVETTFSTGAPSMGVTVAGSN